MQAQEHEGLTEYEAQLYDRSIRCWGIEAQKRIRLAKILLLGIKSLNAEICKNLVLAGINSVTIIDDECVLERDLGANIFLTADDIGKSRAEAAVPYIQALNPLVEVKHTTRDAMLGDSFLKSFNIICATNCLLSTLFELNKRCRELGIYFIAADTFCMSAYFFSDLRKLHYIIAEKENTTDNSKNKENNDEPPVKKARKDFTADFVSLEKALSTRWSKLDKRTAKLFYGMQLVYALKEEKTKLDQAYVINTKENVLKVWKRLVVEHDGNEALLSEEYKDTLIKNIGCEFVPVSAIVGGIAAQEMIKILSADAEPLNNFFFYDSTDGTGLVEKIG